MNCGETTGATNEALAAIEGLLHCELAYRGESAANIPAKHLPIAAGRTD
jgi:hypothetical protein